MGNIKLQFSLLIAMFISIVSLAQERVDLKIVNKQGEPLLGVYVIQVDESLLGIYLGSSDEYGKVSFQPKKSTGSINIMFNGLGYNAKNMLFKDIVSNSTIVLEEVIYALEEVTVNPLDVDKAMKTLYKRHENRYSSGHYLRYYGYGHYAKVVESREQTVSKVQEYGLFVASGNSYREEFLDVAYKHEFIPIYVARSFDLITNVLDTLKDLKQITNTNEDYHARSKKIDMVIRQIYLFGPIFSDPKNFTFEHIDVNGAINTISFKSKASSYPIKNECLSVGTFRFDIKSMEMLDMDFSYFYYTDRLDIKRVVDRDLKVPIKTQVSVKIGYDSKGQAYVTQCFNSTFWNYQVNENNITYRGIRPSRPFASMNQLIEKEYWKCDSYEAIPEDLRTANTLTQAEWASLSGVYDELFFKKHPFPLTSLDEYRQLNHYMPLRQQYRKNSEKMNADSTYLSTSSLAKREILKKFQSLSN